MAQGGVAQQRAKCDKPVNEATRASIYLDVRADFPYRWWNERKTVVCSITCAQEAFPRILAEWLKEVPAVEE